MEFVPKHKLLELPDDILPRVREIYNLDKPERLKEAVDILEEWVKKQSHFLKKDFTREYYELTLISCKGSIEKAKKQLDRLCTMKTLLPKFFTVTNVKIELKNVLEIAYLLPLPTIIEEYYRVLLLKINSKHFTAKNFMEYFQFNIVLCEYMKRHDYVNGFIVVEDFREVNLSELLSKMNIVELQQIMTIMTEGYGARLRNIYMISESKTIELLVNIVKQFLSKKISSRLVVVSTLEELHAVVPKDVLPEDYGGMAKSSQILINEWIDALSTNEHAEYLKMMYKAGTDESLRHTDKFNEDYMGMPGSFTHLSVD